MSYRWLIGKDLQNGKYKIVAFIGRGGMAEVYEGFDTKLKRKVAIKILGREYINNPYLVRRFYEEAQIAANCDHPNIVKIYDIHNEGEIHYFVMQYLPRTLANILKEKKVLLPIEVMKILKPIAEALVYTQNRGIVHKDIKPANIMFTEHGVPVLTDFGIALHDDSTRFQGAVATGTPEYMSPEQIEGKELDFRSDIYSLGIVLYESVTGGVPFQADEPHAVLYQHIHKPLPEKPLQEKSVPKPVCDVLRKCLAKSPIDRYQSAEELVSTIDEVIKTLSVQRSGAGIKYLIMVLLGILVVSGIIVGRKYFMSLNPEFLKPIGSKNRAPFATVSLLIMDSIAAQPVPFFAELSFRTQEQETTFSIQKGEATIKLYSENPKTFLVSPNLSTQSSLSDTFTVFGPFAKPGVPVTIWVEVPYYEGAGVSIAVNEGDNKELKIKLQSKQIYCGGCGKQFDFGDTICSKCEKKREK